MSEIKKDAKYFVERVWPKVSERLQISKVAMDNGMEMNEGDLEIIRAVHKAYFNGELPEDLGSLDSALDTITDNIAKQGSLFDARSSCNADGTDIEDNRA